MYILEGDCPGGKKTGRELSGVENRRKGNCPGWKKTRGKSGYGKKPEENCPDGEETEGELSGVEDRRTLYGKGIVWVGKKTKGELSGRKKDGRGVRVGKKSEGNCPGWEKDRRGIRGGETGGELSGRGMVRVMRYLIVICLIYFQCISFGNAQTCICLFI